jgi:hypothetical protein
LVAVDSWGGLRSLSVEDEQSLRGLLPVGPFNKDTISAIVDLDDTLPECIHDPGRGVGPQSFRFGSTSPTNTDGNFWNLLANRSTEESDRGDLPDAALARQVCVICSSRQLRHADAAVSRHLSWERSVESLGAELRLFPQLQALSQFGHLIVRFGCVAAAHIYHERGSDRLAGQLVFAPCARDGVHRDRLEEGDVVGYKSLITAALVRSIAADPSCTPPRIAEALRTGLLASMRLFDKGYLVNREFGKDPGLTAGISLVRNSFEPVGALIRSGYTVFTRSASTPGQHPNDGGKLKVGDECPLKPHEVFGVAPIPCAILGDPNSPLAYFGSSHSDAPGWEILRESLNNLGTNEPLVHTTEPSAKSLTCGDGHRALRAQSGSESRD